MGLRRLRRLVERAERGHGRLLPIRRTGQGIWVPTPVPMIERALELLAAKTLLGAGAVQGHLIDAGSGDGRVTAALALTEPHRAVYGVEMDPALHAQASDTLAALGLTGGPSSRVRLIDADYCDPETFRTRAIALDQIHIVFNYPDGNQCRLASFVARHCAPTTALCFLTHNRAIAVDELELRECWDVPDGDGPQWRMSLYGPKK